MKIVLAIDDSPYSREVIAEIADISWQGDTEFKILNVLEPLEDFDEVRSSMLNTAEKVANKRMKQSKKICTEARRTLAAKHPGASIHFEIRQGNTTREIIDSAVEWEADRIVLGAHSKDICPHSVLGSVSQTVAAHAPCSVEIIRPRIVHKKQAGKTAKKKAGVA